MKLGWQVVIVVAAVGTGLYLSKKPWEVYREQRVKSDLISQDMQSAEHEREELMKEKAKMSSPLGREEKMREKNWRRPGETPVESQ